jgi:serine/threonine protein kinase
MQTIPHGFEDLLVELSDYSFERQLTSTRFSNVYLAHPTTSTSRCVIKQMSNRQLDSRQRDFYHHQISVLLKCKSPWIVTFLGYTDKPPYSIVVEYLAKGSLFQVLHKKYRKLSGTEKTAIAFGIACSLAWLHTNEVVHGDLTSSSVFLTEHMQAKLAPSQCSGPFHYDSLIHPTANFAAPEVLAGRPQSAESDVFSYGIVIWELLTEEYPFENKSAFQIASAWSGRTRLPIPENVGGLTSHLAQCWAIDPNRRPSMSDICDQFRRMELNFPDSDEAQLKGYFESPGTPIAGPPPADTLHSQFTDKIGLPGAQHQVSLVEEASKSVEAGTAYLRAGVRIAISDRDILSARTAALSMIYFLTRHPQFVEVFIQAGLHKQLRLDVPELAEHILSLYLPLFESHPEVGTEAVVEEITHFISVHPRKVLRLLALLCQSCSDHDFYWKVADTLLIHGPLYFTNGMVREFMEVLYFMTGHFRVFRQFRSKSILALFRRLFESESQAVLKAAYLMFTSLKLKAVAPPADVLRHIADPALRPAVLRWLTVCDVTRQDCSIIDKIVDAPERKLVVSVLWRFARIAKFGRSVIEVADSWVDFEGRDKLKLVLALLECRENRGSVAAMRQLGEILRCGAETGPEAIPAVTAAFRRLPLTPELVHHFDETGLVGSVAASSVEEFRSFCLFFDALLHTSLTPSVLRAVGVISGAIRKDASAQKYGLPVLVAFSFFPQARDALMQAEVTALIDGMPTCAENVSLIDTLKRNVSIA